MDSIPRLYSVILAGFSEYCLEPANALTDTPNWYINNNEVDFQLHGMYLGGIIMATAIVGILVLVALVYACKGVIKHWRGESSCCGGGDVKVPKKKLTGTIVATKVVDIKGMTCGHCKARVERRQDDARGQRRRNPPRPRRQRLYDHGHPYQRLTAHQKSRIP